MARQSGIKILEEVDVAILQKAETLAKELRANLSAEAKTLRFEYDAWQNVRNVIEELKEIITLLNIASRGGKSGGENLAQAQQLITDLYGKINAIHNEIAAAITMDSREGKVAQDAESRLKNIYGQLKTAVK